MTQHNSGKRKKAKRKPEKLEFVQDFIPIKDLRHGIIQTTDGRYIKILEIEPINFMLRSDDEQFSITCGLVMKKRLYRSTKKMGTVKRF